VSQSLTSPREWRAAVSLKGRVGSRADRAAARTTTTAQARPSSPPSCRPDTTPLPRRDEPLPRRGRRVNPQLTDDVPQRRELPIGYPLGDTPPHFKTPRTPHSDGEIKCYDGGRCARGVLVHSQPADFHPGLHDEPRTAVLKASSNKRQREAIALSVDSVEAHKGGGRRHQAVGQNSLTSDHRRPRPHRSPGLRHDPPGRGETSTVRSVFITRHHKVRSTADLPESVAATSTRSLRVIGRPPGRRTDPPDLHPVDWKRRARRRLGPA